MFGKLLLKTVTEEMVFVTNFQVYFLSNLDNAERNV
jgi:hypothetical protein